MKCVHCAAVFSPAGWERLPSPFWSVSFTCPRCDRENRVPWLVSAGFMLLARLAILPVGLLVATVMPVNLSGWVVAVVVTFSLFATFVLLLSQYLRRSKSPFVSK